MRRIIALAVSVCVASIAYAQSLPQSQGEWPQEPVSFLGIAFGQSIRASVPECPKITEYGSTRYEPVGFGRPCFESVATFYEVYNVGQFFDVFVREIDGEVEYVSAKFNNGNAPSLATVDANGVAAALTEKFGRAHSTKTEVLHNNTGASFGNQILQWRGKNVTIEFDSVAGEYNHGLVCAYTGTYVAHQSLQQRQQQDSLKGVF